MTWKPGETRTVDAGKYDPHRHHRITLVRIEEGQAFWRCEDDGKEWHNAWDPAGDLGSDEAPEG